MPGLASELRHLLSAQHDIVGRWQLTPNQRRAAHAAVLRGEWKAPTNQTFFAGMGVVSVDQRMWVALLHGGTGARLAGRTALSLHGWSQPLTSPYHVVTNLATTREKTPNWVRLHRSTVPGASNQQPPRVNVHLATIQAAAWAKTDREAMFIVLSVLQQRLTHSRRLKAALTQNCKRRRLILNVIGEFAHGITSINEHDFANLCRR